jgi:hypothetical protein
MWLHAACMNGVADRVMSACTAGTAALLFPNTPLQTSAGADRCTQRPCPLDTKDQAQTHAMRWQGNVFRTRACHLRARSCCTEPCAAPSNPCPQPTAAFRGPAQATPSAGQGSRAREGARTSSCTERSVAGSVSVSVLDTRVHSASGPKPPIAAAAFCGTHTRSSCSRHRPLERQYADQL